MISCMLNKTLNVLSTSVQEMTSAAPSAKRIWLQDPFPAFTGNITLCSSDTNRGVVMIMNIKRIKRLFISPLRFKLKTFTYITVGSHTRTLHSQRTERKLWTEHRFCRFDSFIDLSHVPQTSPESFSDQTWLLTNNKTKSVLQHKMDRSESKRAAMKEYRQKANGFDYQIRQEVKIRRIRLRMRAQDPGETWTHHETCMSEPDYTLKRERERVQNRAEETNERKKC